MHKLAKGLKKKKKGKKSKHKEEELFKPEELEAYRREHATGEGSAKNEEWKNFLSLTSGVDDVLKKTQDDLDRIKSTSFFQRIPPPSETEAKRVEEQQQHPEPPEPEPEPKELGIVPVSDSESEEEDEDDVFNTAYIDAITTGEVKLAYIPDSPVEQPEDDPFDTSIAERAILGPAVEKKGKKLVPLGAAVEVLTGRVQLPTCATKPPSSRRQILKQQDLLLGSFDSGTEPGFSATPPEPVKTLLDDDEIPLPDEPIDLSKTLYIPPVPVQNPEETFKEFEENEEDKEFEALAAESLTKQVNPTIPALFPVSVDGIQDWKPFAEDETVEVDDPFDTSFAQNILPGKAELRLIEKEILKNTPEITKFEDKVPELTLIKPVHRDLLGGSTSDLSNLSDKPIQPTEDLEIRYCDPFDTSIVDVVTVPGQAELKCLEKELLSDLTEDDFDPRALEPAKTRTLSRPDVLNVGQSKSVSFSVPLAVQDDKSKAAKPLTPFYVRKNSVPAVDPFDTSFVPGEVELNQIEDLLTIGNEITAKVLTPAAEEVTSELLYSDPFDTSIATNILPGKAELKLLENELIEKVTVEDPGDLLVHSGDTIIEKPLTPVTTKH